MISFASPLPIGNAVKVLLAPPDGTVRFRLLRKTTNSFTGWDDTAAGVVLDSDDTGLGQTAAIDSTALTNGTAYFYAEFSTLDGATWVQSDVISVTPASAYTVAGPDYMALIRDRVELALNAALPAFLPTHTGKFQVLTAPPTYDNAKWPVVTVHLQSDANSDDAIGQVIASDVFSQSADNWTESDGWLSEFRVHVIGWSLNPDLRITLRKLIKAAILGNVSVFNAAGIVNMTLSESDVEDFETYNAPVYQAVATIGGIAPFAVTSTEAAIDDVTVSVTADAGGITAGPVTAH